MLQFNLKRSLLPLLLFISSAVFSQTRCCDDSTCRQKADRYAGQVSSLVTYLGKCLPASVPDYKQQNDLLLEGLKKNYPSVYNDLIAIIKLISAEFIDADGNGDRQLCFFDALPIHTADNTMAWINYIRDVKPIFPSTEFCNGWKKRFEISQGASFQGKKNIAYLGTVRAYVVYTFSKKDHCGGKVRLMAGPGYFQHSATSYLTLSSKISLRLGDIKGGIFSVGNFNLFGGYNTNFNHFHYAESGIEAELGWFGINLSGVYDTYHKHWGFLAGIVLANKKIKKE